ncbi:MAG: hypothetical protein ACN2B6_09370 [Rickettsiales bacterium]
MIFSPAKPAEAFEKKYGLEGISEQYIFPSGKGYSQNNLLKYMNDIGERIFIDGISENEMEFMRSTLDKLIELNPQLADISINMQNNDEVYHLLNGIVSSYNPSDIAYYLQKREASMNGDTQPEEEPERRRREIVICKHLGHSHDHCGWIPSLATITKIEEQISQRASKSSSILVQK